MQRKNFLFLFVFLLSACSVPSQSYFSIKPSIDAPVSQVGHNKKVVVVLEDARPVDSVIGRSANGEDIKLYNDMLDNIQVQINKGLMKNGFQPVAANKKSAKLVVRILAIQYRQLNTSSIVWVAPVEATVVLEVIANTNEKTFKKIYRTDNKYGNMIPSVRTDFKQINATIANTLIKLLTDKQLIEFLVS